MLGVHKPGSHVGPGESFTYTWQVLEGPSSSDSPCIPYLYYSATDPTKDTNSGLVGPLLVCRKGALEENGAQVGFCYVFIQSCTANSQSWRLWVSKTCAASGCFRAAKTTSTAAAAANLSHSHCLLVCVCILFNRKVWIRSSSFFFLSWMKTWAGIWRKTLRNSSWMRPLLKMTKSLKKAIKCMVMSMFDDYRVLSPPLC